MKTKCLKHASAVLLPSRAILLAACGGPDAPGEPIGAPAIAATANGEVAACAPPWSVVTF